MKLLITGGHLTPALAFIDYLQLNHPQVSIVFVGRLYARKRSKQPAHEKEEVDKRSIPFIAFDSGKLVTAHPFFQLFHLLLFIVTIPKAIRLLIQTKPTHLLTFGGYLGVPLAIAAWMLRIPVVTHEQTRGLGLANRFISFFAKKIALAHASSMKFVDLTKSVVVGNPIRLGLKQKETNKPIWLSTKVDRPILYITGGSQGSEIINTTTIQILDIITKQWLVIHQCGSASNERNYLEELSRETTHLAPSAQKRYFVREWISDKELAWIYHHADLVISRAGANTVEELIQFGLPSILIPLPFAHQDEQMQNAVAMKKIGGAIIIEQKQLSPELLLQTISQLKNQLGKIKVSIRNNQKTTNSCELLFKLINNA